MTANINILLKNEHRLLGLMLFSLIAAVHLGDSNVGNSNAITKSFLIVHFGLFLLWQPVVKQQSAFNIKQISILLLLVSAFTYFFNPWLYSIWSLLLLTLLTGHIFARGIARAAYALAVIVLFLELTLNTTPSLFNLTALQSPLKLPFDIALMVLPLLLLFFPVANIVRKQVDFVRGLLIVLLIVFLCMSSSLIGLTTEQTYIESLAISIMLLSLFLLLTAFLWTPRAGFSGFAQLWEKYLLNIGGPFEQWITHVSTLEANTNLAPEKFLSASLRYLMQQHWIQGVSWQVGNDKGIEGETSIHIIKIKDEQLNLELYAYSPVGPSLQFHAKLLLSILIFYYRAKLQERRVVKQAHLQAIYETGSKLTHDVKNILQTTQTMTNIINDTDSEMQEIMDVIKRQMPLLNQRLSTTLDKLRSPVDASRPENIQNGSVLRWWNQLQLRYTGRHIEFTTNIEEDIQIPLDVYTTVVENLLDNARNKRNRELELTITVLLSNADGNLILSVCDSGSAIPEHIHQQLLVEIIASNDGFGIGLHQSYELAKKHGYNLSVENNVEGRVCFVLK